MARHALQASYFIDWSVWSRSAGVAVIDWWVLSRAMCQAHRLEDWSRRVLQAWTGAVTALTGSIGVRSWFLKIEEHNKLSVRLIIRVPLSKGETGSRI